jgi:hypothetical protein
MAANIKVTARQIRFIFDSDKVWMIQPLRMIDGVAEDLRGYYSVPTGDWENCGFGWLDAKKQKKILKKWVRLGFKL